MQTIDPLVEESTAETTNTDDVRAAEKRGRAWLLWSFVVCPCHLPFSMAALGAIFGGTAFGALIRRNALGVGLVFGLAYLIGLAIAFRHLRAASEGASCDTGNCEI
ncbi:MAG: hypothetical protein HKN26_04050 [Acidimicrobiales bacterium]|nr:hypothetical protein [Acidimicrobiales bacterium]